MKNSRAPERFGELPQLLDDLAAGSLFVRVDTGPAHIHQLKHFPSRVGLRRVPVPSSPSLHHDYCASPRMAQTSGDRYLVIDN
jgi:hypothetical protein